MLVSNLQQFLRSLAHPLAALGASASAEKGVGSRLEALADSLEPFGPMSLDGLAELLRVAEEYRQTGQIPEWVGAGGKKPAAKSRARAPKAPKLTTADAVAALRDLQARADGLDPAEIHRGVQALKALTAKELQTVQQEFLEVKIGKTKDEQLAAIQKRIDDLRESRARSASILTGSPGLF